MEMSRPYQPPLRLVGRNAAMALCGRWRVAARAATRADSCHAANSLKWLPTGIAERSTNAAAFPRLSGATPLAQLSWHASRLGGFLGGPSLLVYVPRNWSSATAGFRSRLEGSIRTGPNCTRSVGRATCELHGVCTLLHPRPIAVSCLKYGFFARPREGRSPLDPS